MLSIRDLVAQTRLPETTPIRGLPGVTWHVTNPLAASEIATLGVLAQQSDEQLLALPGFGKRRLEALRAELQRVAQEQD